MYHRFLIKDTDRFDRFYFPQLESSLEAIAAQLAETPGPQAEMVLSFVQSGSIPEALATRYPALAAKITSGSLDTTVVAALFASSRNNLLFQKELEAYITSFLNNASNKTNSPAA